MFCGDEVGAIVADMGSSSCKFGTAGEDSPRHVFRSEVGSSTLDPTRKYLDTALRLLSPSMSIQKFVDNEGVINWDLVELIMKYGLDQMRISDQHKYPILFAESHFKTATDKIKLAEIAFEKIGTNGIYIGSNAMLSSFSIGKPTSLVVDIGASEINISTVYDGYELKKTITSTKRGGDWLDLQVNHQLDKNNIQLKPFYTNKFNSNNYHGTFNKLHTMEYVKEMKKWFCFVPSQKALLTQSRQEMILSMGIPSYQLPDGTKILPTEDLCTVPELLFITPKDVRGILQLSYQNDHNYSTSLTNLVYNCLSKVDIDIRKEVSSNLLIVGGGSLIEGLSTRLQEELHDMLPSSYKPKALSPLPVERMFSTWIGGSIVGICGTFQQCWLSKSVYEENGGNAVRERFQLC